MSFNVNISRVQVVMKNSAKVCHAYPNLKPNVVLSKKLVRGWSR